LRLRPMIIGQWHPYIAACAAKDQIGKPSQSADEGESGEGNGEPTAQIIAAHDRINAGSKTPNRANKGAKRPVKHCFYYRDLGEWWATLESNQAWVSPAELQSAAAPCSSSPAISCVWGAGYLRVRGASSTKITETSRSPLQCSGLAIRGVSAQVESNQHPAKTRVETHATGPEMKKPTWVIDKERAKRAAAAETVWMFGLHAVRDALLNPERERLQLVVTKNAADKLGDAILKSGMQPEIVDPRKFDSYVPLSPDSVHQGAALEVKPLHWGSVEEVCLSGTGAPLVVLLDRVTDPHNVGAILRSAEVFGARAVIAPLRHSAPETGALAKTASGALERQPYLRVTNLSDAMVELRDMGFVLIGLDGEAEMTLGEKLATTGTRPVAIVLGAEGPGLREKTRETCDALVKIPFLGGFGSLNVSNAAAVALYAAVTRSA
jgi:23S rRNA (guanosine2251-2'-O)-methyltransferase